MLGLCVKITKADEDIAKDLVHDAFVLAFSSLRQVQNPDKFEEWLRTIVRNVSLRYLERKKKIDFVPITDKVERIMDVGASSDSVANQQDIFNLIDQLPNGYGKVFRLFVVKGFSHREIASILGIEAHSSSSQLSRAKAMLRKMMERRSWMVILFLVMVVPLYLYFWREKSLRPEEPVMTKEEPGDEPHKTPGYVEEEEVRRPIFQKPVVAKNVEIVLSDITQVPDTMGMAVAEVEVMENKRDSMGRIDDRMPSLILPDCEQSLEDVRKKSKTWQMLVAGSLGPALAQNIHSLLSTNNGDIDSEHPIFPEYVKTWEEYSLYMNSIANDKKDTLALIDIANNNRGDIVKRERHARPITFGISLNKPLSERWSLETGLLYSVLKSKTTMGENGYYIGEDQKIHYLGVPLRLSYHIADVKRLSAYVSVGLSLHIPVYGKIDSKYVLADTPAYSDSWHIHPPVQWSTNFSMGVQYKILPKWSLYVEPTLYWYIPNGSGTHTVWTEHPFVFSVPFGIRFTW